LKQFLMKKYIIIILPALFCLCLYSQERPISIPANGPAVVTLNGNELIVKYDNAVILKATIEKDPSTFYLRQMVDENNGVITQTFSITASDYKNFSFSGLIAASEESFPCEAERRQSGTVVVRHTSGLSSSLLNRAVYDRKGDWVISVDNSYSSSDLKISPAETGVSANKFALNINGNEIVLRFRPHYYQKHRGLKYFEPWNYKVWDKPVVGWCSWFAYKSSVTEKDIKTTADVISEKMLPYGLEYLQIDDGYQQETAQPDKWLVPNSKFPGGMNGLAAYISSKGLKPAIWTNVAFTNENYVEANKSMFVTDSKGEPVKGRWLGYAIDGSSQKALDNLIKPIYSGFKNMGWRYFKLDALRHLRYEGYNSNKDYFDRKKADRVEAFRNVVKTVRNEVGKDNFLMACWGIRPELIGLVDGCRIGNDGYGFETLTQYNSFNNIIWRNDPDHIELTEKEAYRSCMATSLTGSLFMLTDKPEIYRTAIIEPALRSIPVLFTLPGQIFDVDPSSSDNIGHINSDLSGSGERASDANRTSPYDLFLLEINRPFENWLILGRAGERSSVISFADLGLPPDKEYMVFEFWSKRLVGTFTGGFEMGRIDSKYNCQVFCIRERVAHPQLIATSRHITCGGPDLKNVEWTNSRLSGKSEIVANDNYTIYIAEPEGVTLKSFTCEGVKVTSDRKSGLIRQITVVSNTSKSIEWVAEY
jgi:alpha-galactosidase